jgi:DNA-binding CsgD family transcriptional regulator
MPKGACARPRAVHIIRDAAVAIDRATRQLRLRDAAEALRLWEALDDGRLILVDEFERDGRRYLVARARPGAAAQRPDVALTPRQREVAAYAALGHANKLIAYELGVSVSTVATHLMAAARKLHAPSRAALIAKARASERPLSPRRDASALPRLALFAPQSPR